MTDRDIRLCHDRVSATKQRAETRVRGKVIKPPACAEDDHRFFEPRHPDRSRFSGGGRDLPCRRSSPGDPSLRLKCSSVQDDAGELFRNVDRKTWGQKTWGQTGRSPFFRVGCQAIEVRQSWRESDTAFFGRPRFRAASGRNSRSSSAATNSGLPRGRPVCVECRSAPISVVDSLSRRNSCHSLTAHRFRQRSISSSGSGSAIPQCAAALDHLHASAASTILVRTGFNST